MARPLGAPPTPPIRGGRSWIPIGDVTFGFTTVFAAVFIALVAAFAFVPESRQWLAASDGLISWLTSATLTLAVAVGIWALGRSSPDSRFRRLIPGAAAVLLLQSLRFGAALFDFGLPTVDGIEVGSLVDLRRVTSVSAERLGFGWTAGILALILVGVATALMARSASRWAKDRVRITDTAVVAYFVAALGIEAAIPALGFFGEGVGAWYATTILGFVGAGLLVIAGLASGDHRTIAAGWRRRIGPGIAVEGSRSGPAVAPRFPSDVDRLYFVRILIATTGVLTPEPVADFVALLTGPASNTYVVTVIEVPRSFLDEIRSEEWHPLTEGAPAWTAEEDLIIARYVEERGTRITEPILAALRSREIEAETVYLEGEDPAATIIRAAEDLDADLVVLGATKQLFDESHWESVSARVMRETGRAVLVVPTVHRDDTGEMDLPTGEIEIPASSDE